MNGPSEATRPAEKRRRRRWAIVLASIFGIAVVLLLAATAAIYADRRLIAATIVQRYLSSFGIESEIEVDRLAWGGFLARVRAGPVDAPDFTAEGVDVTMIYPDTSSWVASVRPQIAAVRLTRPQLRVSYDGDKLSFGSLQRLMDDVLTSGSDVPGPEIAIDDGRVLLATPYGAVTVLADAAIDKNALTRLEASLERSMLKHDTLAAEITGGTISAAIDGDALNGQISLSFTSLTHAGRTARDVALQSNIRGLKWQDLPQGSSFTVERVESNIQTSAADAPEFTAGGTSVQAALRQLEGGWLGDQLRLGGRGELSAAFESLRSGSIEAADLNAQTSLTGFSLEVTSGQWSADATAHAVVDVTDARVPIPGGMMALGSIRTEFDSVVRPTPSETFATYKGTVAATGSLPGQIALRSLRGDFEGETRNRNHRLVLTSLTANGGVPRARALALARGIPGVENDDALASSIASAVQAATLRLRNLAVAMSGDGMTLTARAPVVLETASRARVTLSPRGAAPLARIADAQTTGGFDLDLRGDGLPSVRMAIASYRYRSAQEQMLLDADTQFSATGEHGAVRGIDVSGSGKLQVVGDRIRFDAPECTDLVIASYADFIRTLKARFCGAAFQVSGDRAQLDVANCADVSFDAFVAGSMDQLRDAKGRLCALPNRPVFISQPSGWEVAARIDQAAARLATAGAAVVDGAARVEFSGDDVAIRNGTITLDRANLSDLQATPRVRPISASGALRAIGDDWAGDFALSLGQRRLATVAVKHALDSGSGEAVINAADLRFEPNMLQPADVAPSLAAFGSQIRGRADFAGRVSWSKESTASEGRLTIPGIDVQTPFGAVRQLKTELTFTSLLPITLRASQMVTVERVDVLVPLEQFSATFTYAPEALRIDSASAIVAQGRAVLDPMTYSLAPGATSQGIMRLQNIALERLLEIAGLTDRIAAQARIDGVVPFTVGPDGVRFANGRIAATAPGRISIKREALTSAVGTGADAQAPPNAVQDFAYQALENLAFDRLEGVVNSLPMGRLGVQLHIVGSNDPPQAAETRVGVLDLLRGRAFDRPLPLPKGTPIDLTLDTSVNLDELLESYLNRRGANAPAVTGTAQ